MPTQKKMPDGKEQFGIIIPTEVHVTAKMLAARMGCRISNIYEKGVEALATQEAEQKNPEGAALVGKILQDVDRGDYPLFQSLAAFLKSKPASHEMGMLHLLLDRFDTATSSKGEDRKRA